MNRRFATIVLALTLWLALAGAAAARDVAVTAVASLIDPAKLATLQGARAANPRVLKCVYWLNDARNRGLQSAAIIDEAQKLNLSFEQLRAPLVETALLRNLDIAAKLGCLTPENLERMRHGASPISAAALTPAKWRRSIILCRSPSSRGWGKKS